jgi:hypothetical protein
MLNLPIGKISHPIESGKYLFGYPFSAIPSAPVRLALGGRDNLPTCVAQATKILWKNL